MEDQLKQAIKDYRAVDNWFRTRPDEFRRLFDNTAAGLAAVAMLDMGYKPDGAPFTLTERQLANVIVKGIIIGYHLGKKGGE